MQNANKSKEWKFRLLEIDASELDKSPNLINDIYERKIGAIVVHNAIPSDVVSRAAEHLDDRDIPWQMSDFGIRSVGRYITGQSPDLEEHFAHAETYRAACRTLFGSEFDIDARTAEVFSALSGGRAISVPRDPSGRSYAPGSLRGVLPGQPGLPIHSDCLHYKYRPEFRHLSTLADLSQALTYIITLTVSDTGGETVLYSLELPETVPTSKDSWMLRRTPSEMTRTIAELFPDPSIYEGITVPQCPGDICIMDGTNILHRVTPNNGSCSRQTIGGSLAFSFDGHHGYFWS